MFLARQTLTPSQGSILLTERAYTLYPKAFEASGIGLQRAKSLPDELSYNLILGVLGRQLMENLIKELT